MEINSTIIEAMGNINGLGELALYTNEITGGLIGFVFILIVSLTLFITLKSLGKENYNSAITSIFVGTVLAVIGRFISMVSVISAERTSLIGDKLMWACIVITALMVSLHKVME